MVSDRCVWEGTGLQYNVQETVSCWINNSWQVYKGIQRVSWGRCAYNCQLMNSLNKPGLAWCVIHKSHSSVWAQHIALCFKCCWGGGAWIVPTTMLNRFWSTSHTAESIQLMEKRCHLLLVKERFSSTLTLVNNVLIVHNTRSGAWST